MQLLLLGLLVTVAVLLLLSISTIDSKYTMNSCALGLNSQHKSINYRPMPIVKRLLGSFVLI